MKKIKAVVVTDGFLLSEYAKTAHGLIRGSNRFEILAVIDSKNAGVITSEILKDAHVDIPVVSSIDEATIKFENIECLIVGVATVGGILSATLREEIKKAITYKINIVNGLHDQLRHQDDIVALASKHQIELTDIRGPKPIKDLHFWTGQIFDVDVPIIAVLGMDCALGKRTTTRLITEAFSKIGIHAEMIYTGQTGWMQGSKYGFIFDSTLNDFVSGELEHAIVNCWKEAKPDVIFLEGQSGLRNPSGPCGLEFLISGCAKQVILVHAPNKKYYDNQQKWGEIYSIESEIEIIEKFGSKVIGVALNTQGLTLNESKNLQNQLEDKLYIPVILPLEEGVEKLIPVIKSLLNEN